MAVPLGSTPASVPLPSISQVAQTIAANDGFLSRYDMVRLLARDTPLARATSAAQNAALQWAQDASSRVVKTAASDPTLAITQATTELVNFLSTPFPPGPDDIVLKGSVIIQKKILVLDMEDMVADTGDDLAEVLGQHVTIQLVSTNLADPGKLRH